MSNYSVQDIFLAYGSDYIKSHKISIEQWNVFNSITNCKSLDPGFHIVTCEDCGDTHFALNSCRNRHCPNCKIYAIKKWIHNESSYLLDCPCFHIVTTIPQQLNEIVLYNKKTCYDILFKATSETILTLANDSKWLGAKVGITSVLHTWGQALEFHLHIHSIVTGGLSSTNKWISSKKEYLFKFQVLSSLFKGEFLALLKESNLAFPKDKQYLNDIDKS